jgi:hypothetical protein
MHVIFYGLGYVLIILFQIDTPDASVQVPRAAQSDYRASTDKLLRKTRGSTKIAYSTSDEHVEESHNRPGGTVTTSLGHWASRVLRSGKDPTGCRRWSYICLGKKYKKYTIVTVYRVGHNHNADDATVFQQQYRTQYADETAIVEINPHKQTMIDLE